MRRQQQAPSEEEFYDDDDELYDDEEGAPDYDEQPARFGAIAISIIFHAIIAVLLALVVFAQYADVEQAPTRVTAQPPQEQDEPPVEQEQPEVETEVEVEVDVVTPNVVETEVEMTMVVSELNKPVEAVSNSMLDSADLSSSAGSSAAIGAGGGASGGGGMGGFFAPQGPGNGGGGASFSARQLRATIYFLLLTNPLRSKMNNKHSSKIVSWLRLMISKVRISK